MIRLMPSAMSPGPIVIVHPRAIPASRSHALAQFVDASATIVPLSKHPNWLDVLRTALGHEVFAIESVVGKQTHGFLLLAHVSSMIFGRYLVSLPYLNSNGVIARSPDVQAQLISRAVLLADELNVKYLELRHEAPIHHPDLNASMTSKVHMRLALPSTADQLWKSFHAGVRNQIRKGEKQGFGVVWGGIELLNSFYAVISHNMRDLGTPVYGRDLFAEILGTFPDRAELCVVADGPKPIAAALLLHGRGITEVPTASALRDYNPSCVNMLMYWQLIARAIERSQSIFDFGRSTTGGNTFRFKKQWGAKPIPAVWQYSSKRGGIHDMRPDNPRYQRAIRMWQRLPVPITRYLGPMIVRGIP